MMPTLSETVAYGIHASLPTFDATCHERITKKMNYKSNKFILFDASKFTSI
jgi:hypothetical protein